MAAPYTGAVLRYAITDRKSYDGNNAQQLDSLVRQAGRWAVQGIDLIQLREKDLPARDLAKLTWQVMAAVAQAKGKTRVLVSSRADIAVAAGANGVHLTAALGEMTPVQIREVFRRAGRGEPALSISCHTLEVVRRAAQWGVDVILFGPVFAKVVDGAEVLPGVGLERLREACEAAEEAQVLALGGVTADSATGCLDAGAAGVAGIRLFRTFLYQ